MVKSLRLHLILLQKLDQFAKSDKSLLDFWRKIRVAVENFIAEQNKIEMKGNQIRGPIGGAEFAGSEFLNIINLR